MGKKSFPCTVTNKETECEGSANVYKVVVVFHRIKATTTNVSLTEKWTICSPLGNKNKKRIKIIVIKKNLKKNIKAFLTLNTHNKAIHNNRNGFIVEKHHHESEHTSSPIRQSNFQLVICLGTSHCGPHTVKITACFIVSYHISQPQKKC